MATYVNNLRLTELATGEGSGTWGTTTNTNLELIGEALGYGSEAIANASTHTITVADGTADSARSFYLKLTGGGQACTVTLAPNTLSKVWMVENTTNSTLTFSQGSGANVAIAAGAVKMIATDGAGSGAVVYDLLVDTDLTGTTTVVNLTSSGTIDAATVEFNSLSGTGSVAITDILDQDNMSSDSATALATQQSIKAYVDSSVASFDTLAEVLAQGNTTGSTDIEVTTAQKVQFRDSAIYINSSADGQLDIVADTEIQIAATTIDANGNLDVSGTIAAGGVVTANAGVVVDTMTLDGSTLTSTGDFIVDAAADIIFDADANDVLFKDGGTEYFRITNNGTSFVRLDSVGDIILDADGGDIYLDDGGTGFGQISGVSSNLTIKSSTADKDIIFQGNDGGSSVTALTLDMSAAGSATFNSTVTSTGLTVNASGGRQYINSGHLRLSDGYNIEWGGGTNFLRGNNSTGAMSLTATGDLTLDVAGNINLDADGGQVILKDGGTQYGNFLMNNSGDLSLHVETQDKDIKFSGNDGGSAITALTLDMSNGGRADFNNDIGLNDGRVLRLGNGDDTSIYNDGSHFNIVNTTSNHDMLFKGNDDGANITALTLDMSAAGAATFNSSVLGTIINAGAFSSVGIGGSMADANAAEMGPGYLNIARDDTADAKQLSFYKNGAIHSFIETKASALVITSRITDADILITGNDGGQDTTFLTFDSSAAGAATFNSNIVFGDGHFIGDDADDNLWLAGASNENIIIDSATDIFLDAASENINLRVSGNNFGRFQRTSSAYLSVQSNGGNLRLGANNTDYWSIDEYRIYPITDNVDDIGLAANRVKDLYLSGGVFLGGTGAANKLEDYEEGAWTPVTKSDTTTITTTVNYAKYVKIGALVYVTAFVSRNDSASLTDNIKIEGLPFQVAGGSAQVSGSIWFDTTSTDEVATNYFVGGTSFLQAKKVGANGGYVTADQLQNGRPYYMSGVYNIAI